MFQSASSTVGRYLAEHSSLLFQTLGQYALAQCEAIRQGTELPTVAKTQSPLRLLHTLASKPTCPGRSRSLACLGSLVHSNNNNNILQYNRDCSRRKPTAAQRGGGPTMQRKQKHMHFCCCAYVALLCFQVSAAAPLTVVNSIHDIWGNVAMQAAEVSPSACALVFSSAEHYCGPLTPRCTQLTSLFHHLACRPRSKRYSDKQG